MGETASAAPGGHATRRPANPAPYSERLYVPWWGWPLPLIGAGLLAAEIHLGYPGVRAWLPYLVLIPLMLAMLLALGRTRVRVTGTDEQTELWVGQAHLPLKFVGDIEVIDKNHKRKALGPQLDPTAFVLHRGWVGPLLRVRLTDPSDPTPYWLFSTRRPERLAELIRATRASRP